MIDAALRIAVAVAMVTFCTVRAVILRQNLSCCHVQGSVYTPNVEVRCKSHGFAFGSIAPPEVQKLKPQMDANAAGWGVESRVTSVKRVRARISRQVGRNLRYFNVVLK